MTKIKAAIVDFLGSNCTIETYDALKSRKYEVEIIKPDESNIEKYNLIVLPGGFSYGDYVKAGRIAKFSPVVEEIKKINKSNKKVFVLGICNGFQILTESGFLKGALIENITDKFICRDVLVNFNNQNFTLPIAHKEGRYYIENFEDIKDYEIIKYIDNPNGSKFDIAGLYDKKTLIMGLMPHPERNMITPFKAKGGSIIFDFIENEMRQNGII